MDRAFITGITGQDGSYLAELLLAEGYEVHGLVRRPDTLPESNIGHLVRDPKLLNKQLFLHAGTLENTEQLRIAITRARPNEFYHLADCTTSLQAQLATPEATAESAGMATLHLLEIIRGLSNAPKFLFASSWEVFGSSYAPHDEHTPLFPTTPHGAAKAFSQQIARIYRLAYKLQTCSAVLYCHESPRRRDCFVVRKVCKAVARIKKGLQSEVQLGSLSGQRDWGWAPDYVRGMSLMLRANTVDDFLFATGRLHSVEQMVAAAFSIVGLNWRDHVEVDGNLVMRDEPVASYGNPGKARRLLGWENTVSFEEMIQRLVQIELDKLS